MTLYQPTNKQTNATRPPREFMSIAVLVCLMEPDFWNWEVLAVEVCGE